MQARPETQQTPGEIAEETGRPITQYNRSRGLDPVVIVLAVVALLLLAVAAYQGGVAGIKTALIGSAATLGTTAPLIVLAFIVAGLIQQLLSREMAARWLGEQAGFKGIMLASVAGALMPGGPYVYYPIALTLFQARASVGVVVAFIVGKNVWGLSRLPLEFALMGPTITTARIVTTLFVPPLAGLLAQHLFGQSLEDLRTKLAVQASQASPTQLDDVSTGQDSPVGSERPC